MATPEKFSAPVRRFESSTGLPPYRRRGPLAEGVRGAVLVALGTVALQGWVAEKAFASPTGGVAVAGEGSISTPSAGNTVIHQQSHSLALQWSSFDVAVGEKVTFNQPSASSTALNRILSHAGSTIAGAIEANGRVFLINPNGIVFSKTAQVNVNALFASSLDISVADFMAGRYEFASPDGATPGYVINRGIIEAASGGSVSLVGGKVANEGLIVADVGQVNMAAGSKVLVDFDGDGLIRFEIDGEVLQNETGAQDAVSNTGEIRAEGGQVLLSAQVAKDVFTRAVNNDGLVKAGRIDKSGGKIMLAGLGGAVRNAGTVDASGVDGGEIGISSDVAAEQLGMVTADASQGTAGRVTIDSGAGGTTLLLGDSATSAGASDGVGGTVHVLGGRVGLADSASVDASGGAGGGTVLIGGDYQGSNAAVRNAERTYLGADTRVAADAVESGDGGTVIAWADDAMQFYGAISARGGAGGGDGGFVETSGAQQLHVAGGRVDAAAPAGKAGTWLLDPGTDLHIVAGATEPGNVTTTAGPPVMFEPNNNPAAGNISVTDITTPLAAGTSVIVTTNNGNVTGAGNGNISVDVAIAPDFATTGALTPTLTLNAFGNVAIGAGISALNPGVGSALTLNVQAGTTVSVTAPVNLTGNGAGNGGSFTSSGTTFTSSGTGTITTDGGALDLNGHTGSISIGAAVDTGGGSFSSNNATAHTFTQTASIDVGAGTLTIRADDVLFTGGAGTISGAGGSVVIEPTTTGGNINIGAAGNLSLDATDIAAFANGFAGITIGRADGTGTVTVSTSSFRDALTILSSDAGGTINVTGNLDTTASGDAGALTLNSDTTTTLSADLTTAGGNITINDNVVLGANGVTLDTGGGSGGHVEIGGTVNADDSTVAAVDRGLTVIAGSGDVTLSGAAGTATDGELEGGLTLSGATIVTQAITTSPSDNATDDGDVAGAVSITSAGGNVTVNGAIITVGDGAGAGGNVTINATGGSSGNVSVQAINTSDGSGTTTGGDIVLTSANGGIDVNGTIITDGGNFTGNGTAFDNTTGTITTSGGLVDLNIGTGAVTIGATVSAGTGNFTSDGGTFTNAGTTTTAGNIAITHTGVVTLNTLTSVVDGAGNSGNITVQGSTVNVNGAVSTALVTFTGNVATGNVSITSNTAGVSIAGSVASGNALSNNVDASNSARSGDVTIMSATSVTGVGTVRSGTSEVNASSGGGGANVDTSRSGNVSVTATAGNIALSAGTPLIVGASEVASATDTNDTATSGNLNLTGAAINNGTLSTALGVTTGVAMQDGGGGTANLVQGALSATTTGAAGAAGEMFLTSGSNLTLGTLATAAGAHNVSVVVGNNNLTKVTSAGTDAVSGDTIVFDSGTGTATISDTVFDIGAATLTITANNVAFTGGADSIRGTGGGTLIVQPTTTNRAINIGAAGDFSIDATDIAALQTGFGNVTIGRTNSTGVVTVAASTFKTPLNIATMTTGNAMFITGDLTLTGTGNALSISMPGTITMTGNLVTDAGDISVLTDVALGNATVGNTTFTVDTGAGGGDVTFGNSAGTNNTLTANDGANSDYGLTVTAGTGDITFNGNVGVGTGNGMERGLTLTGRNITSQVLRTSASTNNNDQDDAGGNLTITATGTVDVQDSILARGGTRDNTGGNVTVNTSGANTISVQAIDATGGAGGNDDATGGPINLNTGGGTGAVTLNGNLTSNGDGTGTGGAITIGSPAALGGPVFINTTSADNTNGGVVSLQALSGAQNLDISADAATVTINGAVSGLGNGTGPAINVQTTSTGLVHFMSTVGTVTGIVAAANTNLQFDQNVTLGDGATATNLAGSVTLDGLTFSSNDGLTINALTLSGGPVTLNSNGNATNITTLTGAQNLIIGAGTAGGTTTVTGAVTNLGNGTGAALDIASNATGLVRFQGLFGANSGLTSAANTSVQFDENVTLMDGSIGTNLAGAVNLSGMTFAGVDGLTFGAVTLSGGPVTLNSNGNATSITTLTGAQNLIIGAGTAAGTTTVTGAVTNLGNGTGAALDIATGATGLVRFQNTVATNAGITSAAGTTLRLDAATTIGNGGAATNLAGNLTVAGTTTVATNNSNATLSNVTLAEGANVTLGTGAAGGNLIISGNTTGTTGGGVELLFFDTGTGSLTLGPVAGNAAGMADPTGLTNVTVTQAGAVTFGNMNISGNLTQVNGTGLTRFNGAGGVVVGSGNTTATAGGNITLNTATVEFNEDVTGEDLGITTTGNVEVTITNRNAGDNLTRVVASVGDITITAGGTIIVRDSAAGPVDGQFSARGTPDSTVSLSAAQNLETNNPAVVPIDTGILTIPLTGNLFLGTDATTFGACALGANCRADGNIATDFLAADTGLQYSTTGNIVLDLLASFDTIANPNARLLVRTTGGTIEDAGGGAFGLAFQSGNGTLSLTTAAGAIGATGGGLDIASPRVSVTTTSGDATVNNTSSATYTGTTTGGDITVSQATGNIVVGDGTSGINLGAGNLSLTATTGSISDDDTGGVITANVLNTTSRDGTVLDVAHAISTFNATNTTSGLITISDTGALNIGATGINNATRGVNITTTGALTDTGQITAGLLTTNTAGGATLDRDTVLRHAVTSFNATNNGVGTVLLRNSSGGTLTVTGISNTGAAVTIDEAGAIAESGIIDGSLLTANAANGVALATSLHTVTSFASTNTTAGTVSLRDAGGLDAAGIDNATRGVTLNTTGVLTDSATITAGLLTTTSQGGTTLDLAGRHVVTSFNATNNGVGTVQLRNASGGTLTVTGISNAGADVTLDESGAIAESGAISGNLLTANAANGVALGTSAHAVTSFASTNTTMGTISLRDANGFDVAAAGINNATRGVTLNTSGVLTDTGQISAGLLTTITTGGATLDLAGRHAVTSYNATNTGGGTVQLRNNSGGTLTVTGVSNTGANANVTIEESGAIAQSGVINGSLLTANAANGVALGTSTNTVTAFASTNTTANAVELTNSSGTLTINGISNGARDVTINQTGAIADGGVIAAGLLTANASNGVALATSAHTVTSFASTNGAGSIAFQDTGTLDVAAGGINNGARPVSLVTTGALTDTGPIVASTLTTNSGAGAQTLDNFNGVGALDATSAGGTLMFTHTGALGFQADSGNAGITVANTDGSVTLTGPVNAGTNDLNITTIETVPGVYSIVGSGLVTADDLTLVSDGGIGTSIASPINTVLSGNFSLTTAGGAASGDISIAHTGALTTDRFGPGAPATGGLLATSGSNQTVSIASTAAITYDEDIAAQLNVGDTLILNGTATNWNNNITGGAEVRFGGTTTLNASRTATVSRLVFNGPVVAGGNNLTVNGATTLNGNVSVTGAANLLDFDAVTVAGDTVLQTNRLTFAGPVTGASELTILPLTQGTAINVGGAADTLLGATTLASLNGFGGSVNIGGNPSGTPAPTAGNVTVTGNLTLTGPASRATVFSLGDVFFDGNAGGKIVAPVIAVAAFGTDADTGFIRDNNTGASSSGSTPKVLQASQDLILIANVQAGEIGGTGGRLNVNAANVDLRQVDEDFEGVDNGLFTFTNTATALGETLATGFAAFLTNTVTIAAVPPNVSATGLETTGLGELGFIDEGLFLLPSIVTQLEVATKQPWYARVGDTLPAMPDNPNDDDEWEAFLLAIAEALRAEGENEERVELQLEEMRAYREGLKNAFALPSPDFLPGAGGVDLLPGGDAPPPVPGAPAPSLDLPPIPDAPPLPGVPALPAVPGLSSLPASEPVAYLAPVGESWQRGGLGVERGWWARTGGGWPRSFG